MIRNWKDRARRAVGLGLLSAAASMLVAAAAASEPPGLVGDFDAAAARIQARSNPVQTIGLDDYQAEAAALAKSYGPSAVQSLGEKIGGPNSVARTLALMTLVALSDHPAAVEALASHLSERRFQDPIAYVALTYAEPKAAIALVGRGLAGGARHPNSLVAMSALVRFFGEAGDDAPLAAALEHVPPFPEGDRSEIAANLVAFRQRLGLAAEARPRWAAQDRAVWRAVNSLPNFRGLNMSLENRAAILCAAIRFDPSFLKDRLVAAPVVGYEHSLLLKILRDQPHVELVPVLAKLTDGVRPAYLDVYSALASVGTRDALEPLERFVAAGIVAVDGEPDLSPLRLQASQREMLAIRLCAALARRGDVKTLELMERLAEEDSRRPSIRAARVKARDELRKRFRSGP